MSDERHNPGREPGRDPRRERFEDLKKVYTLGPSPKKSCRLSITK
jgi:hypothetical protein